MSVNPPQEYLFVYGTLMRAFSNPFSNLLDRQATFLAEGSVPGILYHIDWYPGAIFATNSASRIWGEIYQLHTPSQLLEALDEYEGVQGKEGEYVRLEKEVLTDSGEQLTCWTYQYNWPAGTLQLIPGGKFTPKNEGER